MSLRTTAQLAGISPAFLSMVENGERMLDRLSHIQAIADALRVSPADLVDSAAATGMRAEVSGEVESSMACLRSTLLGTASVPAGRLAHLRGVEDLARQVDLLTQAYDRCQFARVALGLPAVLAAACARPDQAEAELTRLWLTIYQNLCIPVLREFGYLDLMALALEISQPLAEECGDAVDVAVVAWQRSQLYTRLGLHGYAATVAEVAADKLAAELLRTRRARSVYGRLHITAGLARARLPAPGAAPYAHLAEAEQVAGHDPWPGPVDSLARLSGTSLLLNRLELLCVLGHFDSVPAVLRELDAHPPENHIDSYGFHLLAGSSLAHLPTGEPQATAHLVNAEKIAPHAFVCDPYARRAVGTLLNRPTYQSVRVTLRGLAHRMGPGSCQGPTGSRSGTDR
ncbi:helix-turn-helix transcriptional regulator [Crossiella sp. S99.2]|nr:helix-turn-helix transcriptional regulator [Crossiella sp. S99.2]MCK2257909.1 helix-turn-helix transcriptional regulator [Crossiella sp. S99.1]